jgi:acyl-CoA synthetase (AMP-forming)/AMP-acid ligase II/acyl carrier protein
MILAALLETRAREQPEAMALLAPRCLPQTYAGLWQQVQVLADRLAAAGATPGVPVATVLPNGPGAALGFLGVVSRFTCVPLNVALPAEEMRFYLEDARVRFVVLDQDLDSPVRQTARDLGLTVVEIGAGSALTVGSPAMIPASYPDPGDIALILHTSGTTSKPKLVPLTQANLLASARNIAQGLALEPADRCLNVMPLFHIHGLVGVLLSSLAAGSSVVCAPGFSAAAFLAWVEEFQPTWYSAVPTIHQVVASMADQYRSRLPRHRFRFVRSSSAALSPVTMRLLEAGTGAPVIEAYGMTEASHQMASNPLPPGLRKPGSVGLPAGAEIAIMDDAGNLLGAEQAGEVVIRGPGVLSGYGGEAGKTVTAFTHGWFRTGDLGRLDPEGYLFITGRLKEVVNRGGEKVSPREVDEALLEHQEVAEAAAFGVGHPTLGEDLVAVVVRKAGSHLDAPALRDFLFARLVGYKIPSRIIFVDEIPKGTTGKIQRSSLEKRLGPLLAVDFRPPTTDIERSIESVLRTILGVSRLGLDDNFFALGGDSLSGIRAAAAISRAQGVELVATALFHHPTIAELVQAVERAKAGERDATVVLEREIDAMSDEEVERALAELSGSAGSSGPDAP